MIGAFLAALGLSTAGHDRDRLLNQVDPAIQYADDYEIALVNHSAGARLYAETGTSSSLATYQPESRPPSPPRPTSTPISAALPVSVPICSGSMP